MALNLQHGTGDESARTGPNRMEVVCRALVNAQFSLTML